MFNPEYTGQLCCKSSINENTHTPQGKQVKEVELASSSPPCGPTRSFPGPPTQICFWIPRSVTLPFELNIAVMYHPPCPSPPTHRAENQLDLLFSRSCSTSALSVNPLSVSDHHTVIFSLPLKFTTSLTPTPHMATTCHNVKSLCALLYCSFPTTIHRLICSNVYWGSLLHSTILPLLLFSFCPLTSQPTQSSPWLSESLRTNRSVLRAAERKWRKSPCSLPPPPLWLHLNGIKHLTSTCQNQLLYLQPQETIFLILFSPHPSPSPSFLSHCWWICNLPRK